MHKASLASMEEVVEWTLCINKWENKSGLHVMC